MYVNLSTSLSGVPYTEFSRAYDNFKCPYEKSLETYRMHLVKFFYAGTINL